ncbi:M56 family metallopeptidase [Amycolatopsis sp. 195334CR]|uniref:M56 family metallopeptidase n=1 Tax=Amycolatopsis sp. 195334CR TaxID=2814588 RepID=UPI001F5D443A|nr:M56 family metallopeptidase [Amycolatopsis sp. 195334CR]
MILAAVLLLSTGLVGWLGPRLLRKLTFAAPRVAIAAWLASIAGVLLSAVAGVLLVVLPGHGPADAITAVLHECWSTLSHAGFPQLDPIAALAALALVAWGAVHIGRIARRRRRHREQVRGQHEAALRILRPADAGAYPTLWLDRDEPMAYSFDGPPALVVATSGLQERLSDRELQAVLAHEHAHLKGHHHRLVRIAEIAGSGLHFVPLMRDAPAALHLLVELAADRAAAAECGVAPLRSALLAMTGDTQVRLRELNRPAAPFPAFRSLFAGVTAVLAPALSTGILLLLSGFVWC